MYPLVLRYVRKRGARKTMQEDLHRRGVKEGQDFWLCASIIPKILDERGRSAN